MSDLPIIASAFVSGFVAPSMVAWYALSSQRREQERLSRGELRAVLDEAAHALGESRRAIDRVGDLWKRGVAVSHDDVVDALERHRSASAAAQDAQDRIAIRVGLTNPAAVAFHAAASALDRYAAALGPYQRGQAQPTDRVTLDAARVAFREQLEAYYTAARGASTEHSKHWQRAIAVVTLVLMVCGAMLVGAAFEDSRPDDRRRVERAALQSVVAHTSPGRPRQAICRPRRDDGLGTWTCALLMPDSPAKTVEAIVLDDGHVLVRAGHAAARETCCVAIR